ncbi:MAG: acyl-CoA/acyl-ACP dehydrogenase [Proteobacteria bacterium]|nr:acyl-CoA/acyl-ACP dehydrogenase [Pseudomonadota bacterium]
MTTNPWVDIVDEIGPGFSEGVAERDANDVFAADHYAVLKQRGLITALIPEKFGGGGASHGDMCAILRRLGRYDPAIALSLSMHQHLLAAQCFKHRQGATPPIFAKVASKNLVLVSTGARDWLQSNGTLVAVDGGYKLNARKAFASGCPAGDVAVTSAQYLHPTEGWQVLHFPVAMSAPGVRLELDWKAHGMRATGSNTVVFDDVFVPEASVALTRPRDAFHPVWSIVLTVALPLICSAYVGLAERAAEVALGHANRRSGSTTTQWSVGEMTSDLILAQTCVGELERLANNYDFTPSLELSSRVLALKTHTVEAVQRVCDKAVEAAGGPGFYRGAGLERMLRDARAGHFHPLPRKAQLLFSGRQALGLEPVEFL